MTRSVARPVEYKSGAALTLRRFFLMKRRGRARATEGCDELPVALAVNEKITLKNVLLSEKKRALPFRDFPFIFATFLSHLIAMLAQQIKMTEIKKKFNMRMPSHNGWWRSSLTPMRWLDFAAAEKRRGDTSKTSSSMTSNMANKHASLERPEYLSANQIKRPLHPENRRCKGAVSCLRKPCRCPDHDVIAV